MKVGRTDDGKKDQGVAELLMNLLFENVARPEAIGIKPDFRFARKVRGESGSDLAFYLSDPAVGIIAMGIADEDVTRVARSVGHEITS